jgi:hypothetical protein
VSGQELPRFWIFDLFSLFVGAADHAMIVMFSTEQPGYVSWLDSPTSKGVVDGRSCHPAGGITLLSFVGWVDGWIGGV